MTVKELIEKLKEMPEDYVVVNSNNEPIEYVDIYPSIETVKLI